MKLVVDTSSWIDYFEGSETGEKVAKYIENPENEIITNILNLAELSSFLIRKNFSSEEINKAFNILFSISKTYSFDIVFSTEAGSLHAEMKQKIKDFGLIDAFVLLTARKSKASLITSDEHFRGLKDAILIK